MSVHPVEQRSATQESIHISLHWDVLRFFWNCEICGNSCCL